MTQYKGDIGIPPELQGNSVAEGLVPLLTEAAATRSRASYEALERYMLQHKDKATDALGNLMFYNAVTETPLGNLPLHQLNEWSNKGRKKSPFERFKHMYQRIVH